MLNFPDRTGWGALNVIWTLVVIDVSSKYINPFGYDEHPDLTHHDRLITLLIKADRHGLGRNHVHRIAGGRR